MEAKNYSIYDFRSFFSMVIEKLLNEYLEGFNAPILLFFSLFMYLMVQSMMKEMKSGN